MSREPRSTSFWTTMPGVLAAIAAVVTAVGGLITALALTGVFGSGNGSPAATRAETAATGSPPNPCASTNSAPTGAIRLASFELDTEGWGPQPNNTAAGPTTRASDYCTDGTYSLEVDPTKTGWFGAEFAAAQNISGKSAVSADVKTVRGSPLTNLAIQLKVGDGYVWCQSPDDLNATGTVTLDLGTMACTARNHTVRRPSDLTQLTQVWLYLHEGSFRVDNVRAE